MLYEEFYFKIIFCCCCYFNSNKVKLIKVYLVFDFFQNRKKNKRYLLDTSSSSSVLVCYKLQLNIVHSERERGENDGRNADCRNVRWRMAQGEIGATWRRCFVVRKWIWVKNIWWTLNILLNLRLFLSWVYNTISTITIRCMRCKVMSNNYYKHLKNYKR